jgi:hypothetical protein
MLIGRTSRALLFGYVWLNRSTRMHEDIADQDTAAFIETIVDETIKVAISPPRLKPLNNSREKRTTSDS